MILMVWSRVIFSLGLQSAFTLARQAQEQTLRSTTSSGRGEEWSWPWGLTTSSGMGVERSRGLVVSCRGAYCLTFVLVLALPQAPPWSLLPVWMHRLKSKRHIYNEWQLHSFFVCLFCLFLSFVNLFRVNVWFLWVVWFICTLGSFSSSQELNGNTSPEER